MNLIYGRYKKMEKKVIAGSYTGPKDREAYKLGYKKKSVPPFVKRIAVSWLVFLIVGVMLGVGITAACLHRTNPDGEGEEQIVEAPPVYGTRDGHVYVSVSASDWIRPSRQDASSHRPACTSANKAFSTGGIAVILRQDGIVSTFRRSGLRLPAPAPDSLHRLRRAHRPASDR